MPLVTLEGAGYELADGETILTCLERHGVAMPSSCRSGVCQSCMLQAVEGGVPESAQKGLGDAWREQGFFLSCCCTPESDLHVARPGGAGRAFTTRVQNVSRLNERIVALRLDVPEGFTWRAGQFVNLIRPDNIIRSYSIASVAGVDPWIELQIAAMPNGSVSTWARDTAMAGDTVEFTGPMGACFYTKGAADQPLFLLGTGTGLAPLYGIARDALHHGHRGAIHLFHGGLNGGGLYLVDALRGLVVQHPNLHYHPCVLESPSDSAMLQGDIATLALDKCPALAGWRVFLCGPPELVRKMQRKCFLAGAGLDMILADAFLPAAS